MALYNKMRPQTFGQMVGQEAAIQVLKGIIKTERIPNALLFIGTRGTGKTTAARVFGKYLNCTQPTEDGPCLCCENCKAVAAGTMDIVELDAASHTGVEDIRKLIESTQYAPTLKRKVYIIDEVHMLSTAAFNALLKTLEEPPQGCFFILCTTEAHKVPITIKSRCMGVDFTRIEENVIYGQLEAYCKKENVTFEEDALKVIARAADGGMRDGWTIFERFLSEDAITVEIVMDSLGMMAEDSLFCLLAGVARKDACVALDALKDLSCRGKSAEMLVKNIIGILTDVVYLHQTGNAKSLLNTESYKEGIRVLAEDISAQMALSYIKELTEVYHGAKASDMDFAVEAAILSIIAVVEKENLLEQRVTALEREIAALKEKGTMVTVAYPHAEEKETIPEKETSCREENSAFELPNGNEEELPLDMVPDEEISDLSCIDIGTPQQRQEPVLDTDKEEDDFSPIPPEDMESFEIPESLNELEGEIGETISLSLEDDEEEAATGQKCDDEKEESDASSDGLDAFLFGSFFDFPRQN